jgi:septal ring factor EnvC (AmiA/AmiB activator)
MTATRADEGTVAAGTPDAQNPPAGPGGTVAARWIADGHRHLMLVLSVLAADAEVASVAPWLQNDSEQIVTMFEEVERLHCRALAGERERERLRREVDQLQKRLAELAEERERLADELTSSVNLALGRWRAGACRLSTLRA